MAVTPPPATPSGTTAPVGVTSTPGSAVPAPVGVTSTPGSAVPAPVGVTSTPGSAVPAPVGVTSTPGSGVTVPVGVTSKAGYGVTVTALVAAVLAYLLGDHSQAQLGSIVGASVAVISLIVTQVGRYVQANSQLKADANRLRTAETTVVHTVDQYDPRAQQQLSDLVRGAIKDELANLPPTVQTVVTDLENQLLPTADEEAAAQPPALAAGGGAG